MPVNAETDTWEYEWTAEDYDTDETLVRIDVTLKGEADPWQGEEFTYKTTFDIKYWEEDLSDDYYITIEEVIVEYEGEGDLEFEKIKKDIDSDKIREKTKETFEFDIEYGSNLEDQYVDIKCIWVFDWHYIWYRDLETTDTENVYVKAYNIDLEESNKPKEPTPEPGQPSNGGGLCLGTIAIIAIPIVAVISLVMIKRRK